MQVFVCFFLFIGFIGVKLLNKIIQVSGAQFHNTSSVYCIVFHHPKSGLLPSPFIPPMNLFIFLIPLPFSTSPTTALPSDSCQSVLYP